MSTLGDDVTNAYMDTEQNREPETSQEHYEQAMRLLREAAGAPDAANLLAAAQVHMTGALVLHHRKAQGPILAGGPRRR